MIFSPIQIIKYVFVSFYFSPVSFYFLHSLILSLCHEVFTYEVFTYEVFTLESSRLDLSKPLLFFLLPLSFPLPLIILNYVLCQLNSSGLYKLNTEDNYKQNYDYGCGYR